MVRVRSIVACGLILLVAETAGACASVPTATALGPLPAVAVVPQPRSVRVLDDAYVWPAHVRIRASGPGARDSTAPLRAYLAENGIAASFAGAREGGDVVASITGGAGRQFGNEGYALAVSRAEIAVVAKTPRGLFYAVQTLQQISARSGGQLRTRAVSIVDRPAYAWRGVHLDVARHFFSVPVIERYIDVAAHYKLNVFHWHLTDDQAWRLESSRYPALTAGVAHYSGDDVRRIVAFAARRYVTVVPEIDLPAHASAALHAYPRLACAARHAVHERRGPRLRARRPRRRDGQFPSPYVHAGGDEVPAPALRAQPQFTRDVERFVESRGRRFAGWDEILTPAAVAARDRHRVDVAAARGARRRARKRCRDRDGTTPFRQRAR